MALKVVFFGSPMFAVPSLEALHQAGHHILAAVCQPDAPKDRGQKLQPPPVKDAALRLGIPVLQPERVKGPRGEPFVEDIKRLRADVGVVAAYGKILPQALLDAPKAGCVNLHASLLPRHRGASPIQHAILEGDKESGVCLMRMILALDAGGVFATATTPIEPQDTAESLGARLATLAATLCVEHLEAVVAGTLAEVPQPDQGMTYAPLLTKEMGRLQLHGDASKEARRVRAMTPWPGAFLVRGGEPFKVHSAVPADGRGTPGCVTSVAPQFLDVACGNGVLRLMDIQPAGKKRMNAGDWVRGARIKVGDRLADDLPAAT